MLIIPTSKLLTNYTQVTELDGRAYQLRFLWIGERERWTVDISTEAGTPIRMGLLLTPGVDLLRTVTSPNAPPGILSVRSTDGEQASTVTDLHPKERVRLVYFTAAEVGAANG